MEKDNKKLEENKEAMAEAAREKYLKEEIEKNEREKLKRHEQSMEDSQGDPNFSGGSSNAPGNVDRSRRHSNMNQRNF